MEQNTVDFTKTRGPAIASSDVSCSPRNPRNPRVHLRPGQVEWDYG